MTLADGTRVSFSGTDWKIDAEVYPSDARVEEILAFIVADQHKRPNRRDALHEAIHKNAELRLLKPDKRLKGPKKKYNPPGQDKAKKLKGKP